MTVPAPSSSPPEAERRATPRASPGEGQRLVAVYDSHAGAEGAIRALHAAGLDMRSLTIVARDFHTEEHARGFYTAGDRMRLWGARGAVWGVLWGALLAGDQVRAPAGSWLAALGPLLGWAAGALGGAAAGVAVGAVAAALVSLGVPRDSVVRYELEAKGGRFLVLADGPAEVVERARAVLAAAPSPAQAARSGCGPALQGG